LKKVKKNWSHELKRATTTTKTKLTSWEPNWKPLA